MEHPALPRAAHRASALLVCVFASSALADPLDRRDTTTFLNAGLLLSQSVRPSGGMFAYGVEASVHHFLDEDYDSGIGLFAQWQGTNADHSRSCGGVQGTHKFLGLELGVAYENANQDFASTTSLHVAPFISAAGFATLAVRVGIPLSRPSGSLPGHGMDLGLVVALKYPLPLNGF